MTALAVTLGVALTLLLVLVGVAGWFVTRGRLLPSPSLRAQSVAVQTKAEAAGMSGESIRGLLVGEYSDAVYLEQAVYASGGGVAGGTILIPRANVAWIQVLPAEA